MSVRWWARFATEVGRITGTSEDVVNLQRTPDVEPEAQEEECYRTPVRVSAEDAEAIVRAWRGRR